MNSLPGAKSGAIHRVYPIGRNDRNLDDLEIKQCLFAGEEVTNPHHLSILTNGTGIWNSTGFVRVAGHQGIDDACFRILPLCRTGG